MCFPIPPPPLGVLLDPPPALPESFMVARIQAGQCARCGLQTRDQNGAPLTIEEEILRGRCLLCHPIPGGGGAEGTSLLATTQNKSSPVEFNIEGRIRANIRKALRNPHDQDLQEKGCKLIAKNANEKNVKSIISFSGIEMIVNAMKNHPQNTDIIIECFRAFSVVSWCCKGNADIIANSGGMDEIVAAIKKPRNNERMKRKVVAEALQALEHLVSTSKSRSCALSSGALGAVIDAMKQHCRFSGIQTLGCRILQDISVESNDVSMVAISGGAVAVIVVAISKSHASGNSVSLNAAAYGALNNLLVDERARLEFVQFKGLEPLIQTIGGKACLDIQECANKVLLKLVQSLSVEDILVPILKAKAVDALATVMRNFPHSLLIQDTALNILHELAFDEESVKEVNSIAHSQVVKAMKSHPNSITVQDVGCLLLGVFGTVSEDAICQVSVQAAIDALKTHPNEVVVQRNGCWALLKYSEFPSAHQLLRTDDVNHILKRAALEISDLKCSEYARDLRRALEKVR